MTPTQNISSQLFEQSVQSASIFKRRISIVINTIGNRESKAQTHPPLVTNSLFANSNINSTCIAIENLTTDDIQAIMEMADHLKEIHLEFPYSIPIVFFIIGLYFTVEITVHVNASHNVLRTFLEQQQRDAKTSY